MIPPAPGFFITLEGGEGAGKTTQAALLAEAVAARGLGVARTREPGGSPGAELLRGILLDGGVDWAAQAEALLHFAARADHLHKTILPALQRGSWVVCDRFTDSTMAYQGYGQGADRHFIDGLTRLLGRRPDLTIVLDVPEAAAAERLARRGGGGDRYERLGAPFHARVRQGFRAIAAAEPGRCVLLDASGDVQAVHAAVMTEMWARLGPASPRGPMSR